MMKDHDDYYFNPYLPANRRGKGESMSSVRASFVFSFAILTSVGAVLLYLDYADRFEMAPARQGLYIFDRKTTATNFCDTFRCVGISPEFILPKKVDMVQIPGVAVSSQIFQPVPTIASLMMPQNQVPMPITPNPTNPTPQIQANPTTATAPTPQPTQTSQPAQQDAPKNTYSIEADEDMGGFIDPPDQPDNNA